MNWPGIIFCLFWATWIPPTGLGIVLFQWWRSRRQRPEDPPRYQVPEHLCSIDLVKSKVSIEGDGSVLATCCVEGCGCTVRLMHNIAEMTVETPQ